MTYPNKLVKQETQQNRGKNLILVSNPSDNYLEPNLGFLLSRNSSRNAPDFMPRNSSTNQLFATFQQEKRPKEEFIKKQESLTDSQKYAQECLQYQKFLFDQKIKMIIHRMSILAYQNFKDRAQHPFMTFFIERLLCALAKKLLLNRFQMLFLEYVFEQSKWKYDIQIITNCTHQFKSFVYLTESENPHGMVKNLQIYLLFCAYYSKKSLNDLSSQTFYNHFTKTIADRFKERYQEWTQVSGVTKIKINPKTLNNIFKKLSSNHPDKETENYNLLVQQILEISPAYNADKQKNQGRPKKKRKLQEYQVQQKIEHDEINMAEMEDSNMQNEINMNNIPIEESQNQYPSLNLNNRKKKTSYVSNVDGFDPVAYYNRNE